MTVEVDEAPPLGALESYDHWERHAWTLADLDFSADREGWAALPPFLAASLRDGVDRFFLGESAVTETLAPLAHAAPSPEARIFLATQLADEARHTLFFVRYLEAVGAGAPGDVGAHARQGWEQAPDALAELLDRELRAITGRVALEAPLDNWYGAVALYHLIVEGVLAVFGQRTLLGLVRRCAGLEALEQGLLNISRDESRHIGFGTRALRDGVRAGYGEEIAARLELSAGPAVEVLLATARPFPALVPSAALRLIGEDTERRLGQALGALLGRVRAIGLERSAEPIEAAWKARRERTLDEYEREHGRRHPVRVAAAGAADQTSNRRES